MNENFLESSLDILRWHTIFELFSMEKVEPYIPKMGLDLDNFEEVRQIAHEFIEQFLLRGDSYIHLSEEQSNKEDELMMQHTFQSFSGLFGQETAQKIYWWGKYYFPWHGPDDADKLNWSRLLRQLAGLTEAIPPLPPSPLSQNTLEKMISVIKDELGDYLKLMDEIDALEKKPNTDWEDQIYLWYEKDSSPLVGLLLAIDFHRFQITWRQLKGILSEKELNVVLQWGRANTVNLGIKPEDLELPALREY